MIVQNLKFPFDHTIIYDFFLDHEIQEILEEKDQLLKSGDASNFIHDKHHQELIHNQNVQSYNVDLLVPNGKLRVHSLKIFECVRIGLIDFENLYLKYLTLCKQCNTFVNIYKNESFYAKHHDASVLTALYILWEGYGNKNGGDFYFTEYEYYPHLPHNSCIVFPSFLLHAVSKLTCDESISRISINQRFVI
jgi:hypothetical protein